MKKLLISISFLFSLTLQAQLHPGIVNSQDVVVSVIYTDDFQAYSAGALATQGNWIQGTATGSINIADAAGDKRVAGGTSASAVVVLYNQSLANNQYSELTIDATGTSYIGVVVRMTGTGAALDGYGWYVTNGASRLFRYDDGTKTNLGSGGTAVINAGDVIRLEVSGTTLSCYINGILDTTVGTSGHGSATEYGSGVAGLSSYDNSGTSSGDLWKGGNL